MRNAKGETLFSLVYIDEFVVPLELEIPPLMISLQGYIQDKNYIKARLQQLEALGEKKIHAIKYQKPYHARIKRDFSKNIKPKLFKVGDLVLKKNINKIVANDEVKGKFEPNWLGSFVVV